MIESTESEPQGKRQRTEEAQQTEREKEQIEQTEQTVCEVPHEALTPGLPKLRANDLIELVFVDGVVLSRCHPDFTHQLFEEERVQVQEGRVTVYVDCADLSQSVHCVGLGPEEVQRVEKGLARALPEDWVRSSVWMEGAAGAGARAAKGSTAPPPPGTLVQRFTTRGRGSGGGGSGVSGSCGGVSGGSTYEIRKVRGTDAGAAALLSRAERLAVWFIETADGVDFQDSRWEALFLYQLCPSATPTAATAAAADNDDAVPVSTGGASAGQACDDSNINTTNDHVHRVFAGYTTIFSFNNPFAGVKRRVCQALILPPFQGQGLGSRLLRAVYEEAKGEEAVVQVTVEDPCEGFQRMRDGVDLQWYMHHPQLHDTASASTATCASPSDAEVERLSASLKLVPPQVLFLLEAIEYFRLLGLVQAEAQTEMQTQMVQGQGVQTQAQVQAQVKEGADSGKENTPSNPDFTSTTSTTATSACASTSTSTSTPPTAAQSLQSLQSLPSFKAFRLRVKRRLMKTEPDIASLRGDKAAMQRALEEEFVSQVERYGAVRGAAVRCGLLS